MYGAQKRWQKPELTVLVRSKPEETVLLTCKTGSQAGPVEDLPFVCFRAWTEPGQCSVDNPT